MKTMNRPGYVLAIALIASCAGASPPNVTPSVGPTNAPTPTVAATPAVTDTPMATPTSEPTASLVRDMADVGGFGRLVPGRYSINPGLEPDNTWRVLLTVPASGWRAFAGPYKDETTEGKTHRFVAVNFFDVQNIVTDACTDHSQRDPVVGTSVDDLAQAASTLSPFEVTSAPTDVTAFGYSGKHLVLTIPDLPYTLTNREPSFTECRPDSQFGGPGVLKSWIAQALSYAYYGYRAPGQIEELWILDVDGRRLMVSAITHPDSPAQDLAELNEIIESIEIRP